MNALAKLSGDRQLSELESLIMGEAANDDSAYDVVATRLTIAPGGIGMFVSTDKTMKFDSLDCIVVVSQKARAYWPTKSLGQPPMCTSLNGLHGTYNFNASADQEMAARNVRQPHPAVKLMDAQGQAPEFYDCASCPLSQWASAAQGNGQACKTLRRLILLLNGASMPVVLTLPPTSVAAWDAYCTSLRQKRNEYFAVRTTLTLETMKSKAGGEPYSVVKIAPGAPLKIDEVRAVIEVRRQFEEWVRSKNIDVEDYSEAQPADQSTRGNADGGQDIPF